MWILGSHNSWSYLTPKKWWMKLIKFTGKCQDVNVRDQFDIYNVRFYDLRIRFDFVTPIVCHGAVVYDISFNELLDDLNWLNNKREKVYIRITLDTRGSNVDKEEQELLFKRLCERLSNKYVNINFTCGENIVTKEVLYKFNPEPSCEEKYSSVCSPKLIDDWYPRLFAKKNNKKLLSKGTDREVLLIDFVNYGH